MAHPSLVHHVPLVDAGAQQQPAAAAGPVPPPRTHLCVGRVVGAADAPARAYNEELGLSCACGNWGNASHAEGCRVWHAAHDGMGTASPPFDGGPAAATNSAPEHAP
eukprot:gene22333-3386_t